MKINVQHIVSWLILIVLGISMLLWAKTAMDKFARYAGRAMEIRIQPPDKKFIVEKEIQNILKKHLKETGGKTHWNIKEAETGLEENPFVENAEVYLDPNGILHADIEQFTPVAKLIYPSGYAYLDKHGKRVPASKHAKANLPRIYLQPGENPAPYFPLATAIYNDPELRYKIKKIKPSYDGIHIKLYGFYPDILLGDTSNVKAGLYKLKMIYAALKRTGKAKLYTQIDLHYKGQAICKKN